MDLQFTYIENLASAIQVPENGILSKTHCENEHIKMVLFGFSKGQELSEHTSSKPALLYFIEGRAKVRLGTEEREFHAGSFVYMPPHLPHAIRALTPLSLQLVLIQSRMN